MRIRRAYWLTLITLALSACSRTAIESGSEDQAIGSNGESSGEAAGTTAGPSSDVPDIDASQVHIVQPGETLYSIAWRHELDLRDLITWNDLQNPDLILADQKLFLAPRATTGTTPSAAQRPDTRLPEPDSPWAWPVRGSIVSAYGASSGTGSGIGIGGEIGADIRAAAQGQVVYAGGGLAAYGNLVIVKHNERFLSAYAHNDRLTVAEGENVVQGQVIAKMGLGPERLPQLHFEIRRDGVSVDPLGYLPE